MNITIKATHHELSDNSRGIVLEKFSSLERLVSGSVSPATLSCEIDQSIAVERAGAKYRAEGNLNVDGRLYRGEASGTTLEEAVDKVRDQLTREFQSAQGKKRGFIKRGGAAIKRMLRMEVN